MKSKPESDLRERALGLLARREHTRVELARKLGSAGLDAGEVTLLLDELEQRNWLSDQRFAESWVADHRARAGSVRLAYDLRQRGVADSIIEAVLGEDRASELDRARDVWRKKFGSAPADATEKARQIRFMQSRGFTPEVIRRAIADGVDWQSEPSEQISE